MIDVKKFYEEKNNLSQDAIDFFNGAIHNNKRNGKGYRIRIRAPKNSEVSDYVDPKSKNPIKIIDFYDQYFDELVRYGVIDRYKKNAKTNRNDEQRAFVVVFT